MSIPAHSQVEVQDCTAMWLNGARKVASYKFHHSGKNRNTSLNFGCYYPHSNRATTVSPMILTLKHISSMSGSTGYPVFDTGWIFDKLDVEPWMLISLAGPVIVTGVVIGEYCSLPAVRSFFHTV